MVYLKALLAGLASVSFCMGNISGIVTDTGSTPLSGVLVKLEKAGQMAVTGSDGQFTLLTDATGISVTNHLAQNDPAVKISGNFVTITLSEQSAVEVSVYDLGGRALSTLRQTFGAGTHALRLPFLGSGIHLYKVKTLYSECVFKGNAVGGVVSGRAFSFRGSSPNQLAKGAFRTAAINDIVTATKTGYLNYRCVQFTSDTAGVAITMIENAGDLTDIDGNVYQTVQIGEQIWITVNLRVTRYNDGTQIPVVTDLTTWRIISKLNAADDDYPDLPAFCYYNYTTDSDSIKKYGALYNFLAVMPNSFVDIAPEGWRVASSYDYSIMERHLRDIADNLYGTTELSKVAKSLAAKTDWKTDTTQGNIGNNIAQNNASGFSALPGGVCNPDGSFEGKGVWGKWWTTTTPWDGGSYAYPYFPLERIGYKSRYFISGDHGLSVRLVADSDIFVKQPLFGRWVENDSALGSTLWHFTDAHALRFLIGTDSPTWYSSWEIQGDTIMLYDDQDLADTINYTIIDTTTMRFRYRQNDVLTENIFNKI